jgi:DNA-directed RNA polymerase subunit RPC12/RpoP
MELTQKRHSVIPTKTGVYKCGYDGCKAFIEKEQITITHRCLNSGDQISLHFCDMDCLWKHFRWAEKTERELKDTKEQLQRKLHGEINWLHSHGLCPRCKSRILSKVHS